MPHLKKSFSISAGLWIYLYSIFLLLPLFSVSLSKMHPEATKGHPRPESSAERRGTKVAQLRSRLLACRDEG